MTFELLRSTPMGTRITLPNGVTGDLVTRRGGENGVWLTVRTGDGSLACDKVTEDSFRQFSLNLHQMPEPTR